MLLLYTVVTRSITTIPIYSELNRKSVTLSVNGNRLKLYTPNVITPQSTWYQTANWQTYTCMVTTYCVIYHID